MKQKEEEIIQVFLNYQRRNKKNINRRRDRTIEKEQNDVYNINMEKIRALSNNLNNSNIINRNKKKMIKNI